MSTEHRTGESPGPGQQPDLSRRSVIRGAAGLAGAGLAAGAIAGAIAAPAQSAAARPARPAPAGRPAAADASLAEPVIVHVKDVQSGEMDVFAGTRHARLHDPGLAAKLARGVS
jgi:hypothetical protein